MESPPTDRTANVVVPLPSKAVQPTFEGRPFAPLFAQFVAVATKTVPGRVGTMLESIVALIGFRK